MKHHLVIMPLLLAFAAGSCNYVAKAPQRAIARIDTLLLVSENFFSGKPWALGLLSSRELQALLGQEFVFKSCNYVTVTGLCKEITRATGKRVEWLPDDEKLINAINEWHYGCVTLSSPADGPSGLYGPPRSIPLGFVLEELVSLCTDAELGAKGLSDSMWTAWVAKDVILLVRLPKKHFSSAAEVESEMRSNLAAETVDATGRGDKRPGLRRATIVLPYNNLSVIEPSEVSDPNYVAPWLPAAPPPEKQKCKLAEVIDLRPGSYSTRGLAKEIGRASGMAVHWMPEWVDRPRAGRKFVDHNDRFNIVQPESLDNRQGRSLVSQAPLADALKYLLGWLTEGGPGYDPPDREVWVAWIADDAIFLISLPGAL